jgi:F-type H+-transporting ATPase subunit b
VISLDYTIFIQMANFLLLILILNILLYKPILGIVEQRKRRLEESAEEIKRLELTVQQKADEYEQSLRQAKLQALEEKNAITADGAEQAKNIIDSARAQIPQLLEEFNEKLAKEVGEARDILHGRSREISLEIAEKVLGRSLQ